MVTRQRFELALERLKSPDWSKFEELASIFMASEYPSLRTVASQSGDRGRDSELFSPTGQQKILIQYSVTQNWKTKIKKTVTRLKETFPETLMLIYMSNQDIGAKADELKREMLESESIILDVRDKTWFLDRTN